MAARAMSRNQRKETGMLARGYAPVCGHAGVSAATLAAKAWMRSAPHRANILNRSFNAVGIGYWRGPDGRLWVCVDFGGI